MSDLPKRGEAAFMKYDTMSEEEIRQILRQDALTPDGAGLDTEEIFYVMEVLAKRRKCEGERKSPEEALETFWNKYAGAAAEPEAAAGETAPKRRIVRSRWIRSAAAAAAVLVLLIGSSVTARAFGFDFWDIVVKWTQETFHFGYVGDMTEPMGPVADDTAYVGLQAALDDYDITVDLVPTWIPEGYEEVEVQTINNPKQRQFYARYCLKNEELSIRITDRLGSNPDQIEQSGSIFEIYVVDEIEYNIFDNNSVLQIIWINNGFECIISGPLSIEEARRIIDSI